MKFYLCKHCGNLIQMIEDSGAVPVCCGDEMTKLTPNTVDASLEKHVPQIKVDGKNVTVDVGSVAHPMLKEHYITWILIHTKNGSQIKYLKPETAPQAKFTLADGDELIAAYEYCNLHGLWKADA